MRIIENLTWKTCRIIYLPALVLEKLLNPKKFDTFKEFWAER